MGSDRETFSWADMCDIDIELPNLLTQQKYVKIYTSMVENQRAYESGLDDLKLTCEAYIENLRKNVSCEKIGPYIFEKNERNIANTIVNIKGVTSSSRFDSTKANTTGLDFSNYKIVKNR